MKRRHFLGTLAASSTAAAFGPEALEAHEPAGAKPMKITLLSTGTPSLDRQCSGYLFEVGSPSRAGESGSFAPRRRCV